MITCIMYIFYTLLITVCIAGVQSNLISSRRWNDMVAFAGGELPNNEHDPMWEALAERFPDVAWYINAIKYPYDDI